MEDRQEAAKGSLERCDRAQRQVPGKGCSVHTKTGLLPPQKTSRLFTLPLSGQQSQKPRDWADLPLWLSCCCAPSTTSCLLQSLDAPLELPSEKHGGPAAVTLFYLFTKRNHVPSQDNSVSASSKARFLQITDEKSALLSQ